MYNQNIIKRIKAEMVLSGITLNDLSKKTKIARHTLYMKFRGETDFKLNEMITICRAIDKPISEILASEE